MLGIPGDPWEDILIWASNMTVSVSVLFIYFELGIYSVDQAALVLNV